MYPSFSKLALFVILIIEKGFYQKYGVREYWLVFPEEKAIEVMTLEGGIYRELCSAKDEGTVRSKLLQGFEVDLKGVF